MRYGYRDDGSVDLLEQRTIRDVRALLDDGVSLQGLKKYLDAFELRDPEGQPWQLDAIVAHLVPAGWEVVARH